MEQNKVKPADGKLGIMVVGCGAVSTTFMTGVFMARKGLAKPVGSMTQYDKIRVGKGADKKYLHYKDIVPMADLNDIVFGTWDVYPQNAYQAAMYAEVLKEKDINPVREELEKVVPMKAAFDKNYAKRLDGDNVKDCKTRWEMVEALRQDIRIATRMFNAVLLSAIRAGGDTKFLLFMDSGLVWLVGIPAAYIGLLVLGVDSLPVLFLLTQSEQVVRMIIGLLRCRSGKWLHNLTEETGTQ